MVKFVTITSQRSGSSHFMRLLDSHPKIEARQEDLRRKQDRNPKFLDELYADKKNCFGFKLPYDHANAAVLDWILSNEVYIIHLIRRDVFRTALFYPDVISGDYKGGMGERLELKGDLIVDTDALLRRMKNIVQNQLRFTDWEDTRFVYEDDILSHNYARFNGLQRTWGIRPRALDSKVNKRNDLGDYWKRIKNFDEVKAAVKANKKMIYVA